MEIIKRPTNSFKNNLNFKDYVPFVQRTENLLKVLDSNKNKELSLFFNYPVYNYRIKKDTEYRDKGIIQDFDYTRNYEGVYSLDFISNFLGNIPTKNQDDINNALVVLQKNPFFEFKNLMVLAPLNNFASTNNVSAIDPIVFALIEFKNNEYLIPITQWD